MQREQTVPLFLWVTTAVLVHLVGYGGTDRVMSWLERRFELWRFAADIRQELRFAEQPVEVALLESSPASELVPRVEPVALPPLSEPLEPPEPVPVTPQKPKSEAEPPRVPELVLKNEPAKRPQAETKPEPPKLPEPPNQDRRRIAVKQHVEDKNQPDNPDAPFIGDHANRVKEQTQARITSTTQDDPNPTPGTSRTGPPNEPGNAEETRVAQDEDRPGEPNRAPEQERAPEQKRVAALMTQPTRPPPQTAGAERTRPVPPEQPPSPAEPATDRSRDALSADHGSWDQVQAARRDQHRHEPRKRRLLPVSPRRDLWLGYGSRARTETGVNLNLMPQSAADALGVDRLARERVADAERRRSTHRGSWKTVGIERWRAAIENYVPMVKPGNQTALNTARVPFASYLNQIHNRIHPIFADTFLVSLDSLPASHPMNRMDIYTSLEIVLEREEGRLVRMGVTKSSGVTAFDVGALESVNRAAPFGPPPPEILSPDGNVYLHWEFHRHPWYACSTYFARPYILKTVPRVTPPKLRVPPREEYQPPEPGSLNPGLRGPGGTRAGL